MQFYTLLKDVMNTDDPTISEFLKWAGGSGTTLGDVYESAQLLWTESGFKMLAVYKGYIIWFQPSQAKSTDHSVSQRSASKMFEPEDQIPHVLNTDRPTSIVVEAFSSIKGIFVESSDSSNSLFPGHSPPIRNTGVEGSWHNHRNARLEFPNQQVESRPFILKLCKQKGGKSCEMLYFSTRPEFEDWRSRLAQNLVFLGDFNTRYRVLSSSDFVPFETKGYHTNILEKHSKPADVVLQNILNRESTKGKIYKVPNPNDKRAVNSQATKLLKECSLSLRLKPAGIVPAFQELCFSGTSFVIIQEKVDAVPFCEWFSNTWCREYGDQTDPGALLTLMIDITAIVYSMSLQGITHGNFCKDEIIVQPVSITSRSRTPSPKSLTKRGPNTPTGKGQKTTFENSEFMQRLQKSKQSHRKVVRSGMTAEDPQSILKHYRKISYRLLLKDMAACHDAKHNRPTAFGGKREDNSTVGVCSADPLEAMGILLCELMFGGDVFSVTGALDLDRDKGNRQALFNMQRAVHLNEKTWQVPSTVISLLFKMVSSTSTSKLTPKECYDCLVVSRASLSKEPKSPKASVQPSGLSIDTLKSALFLEGSNRSEIDKQTASSQLRSSGGLQGEFKRHQSFVGGSKKEIQATCMSLQKDCYSIQTIIELDKADTAQESQQINSLRLPNGSLLSNPNKAFGKSCSWNRNGFHNASTVDNRPSNSDISKSVIGPSLTERRTEQTTNICSLKHYRSHSGPPGVCLSGRALFSQDSKPKPVVPGNGDSVQTITSGSRTVLRLKPAILGGSFVALKKPASKNKNNFFSFRAMSRKNSCPQLDIKLEEPNFTQSGESHSQSSKQTARLIPPAAFKGLAKLSISKGAGNLFARKPVPSAG